MRLDSNVVSTPKRSVYHAPHTFCRCSFRPRPLLSPPSLSPQLYTLLSLCIDYSDRHSSLHYRSPACPPIVTLRETVLSYLPTFQKFSGEDIFSLPPLHVALFKCTSFRTRSGKTLGGKISHKSRLNGLFVFYSTMKCNGQIFFLQIYSSRPTDTF